MAVLAALAESIGLELARKGPARDSQEFGGTLLVPFGLVQGSHDECALHLIEWR